MHNVQKKKTIIMWVQNSPPNLHWVGLRETCLCQDFVLMVVWTSTIFPLLRLRFLVAWSNSITYTLFIMLHMWLKIFKHSPNFFMKIFWNVTTIPHVFWIKMTFSFNYNHNAQKQLKKKKKKKKKRKKYKNKQYENFLTI